MPLGLLARDYESGNGMRTGVRGNGHQLTGFVGVAHVFDDSVLRVSLCVVTMREIRSYVGKKSEIE
jgi:hypothetical protein